MTKGCLIHGRATLHWASITTRIGLVHVAYHDLCPSLVSRDSAELFCAWAREQGVGSFIHDAEPPEPLAHALLAAVQGGQPYAGPVDLATQTPFQRQVLLATRAIPCGEVRTYGQLAAFIGRPRAARAVGTALANNPLPFLIPCHRVVGGGSRLGRYSDGGPAIKRCLLAREGVDVARLR
ncbi:MAG TPA: methylated-DNA--[protein]-cysteine S-methyltransferase [Acidiferrobacter sp.]|nr:methylated-DNA--[protein]-cysteine S-methyltransferase [Acidiferrobacter sp.]